MKVLSAILVSVFAGSLAMAGSIDQDLVNVKWATECLKDPSSGVFANSLSVFKDDGSFQIINYEYAGTDCSGKASKEEKTDAKYEADSKTQEFSFEMEMDQQGTKLLAKGKGVYLLPATKDVLTLTINTIEVYSGTQKVYEQAKPQTTVLKKLP